MDFLDQDIGRPTPQLTQQIPLDILEFLHPCPVFYAHVQDTAIDLRGLAFFRQVFTDDARPEVEDSLFIELLFQTQLLQKPGQQLPDLDEVPV